MSHRSLILTIERGSRRIDNTPQKTITLSLECKIPRTTQQEIVRRPFHFTTCTKLTQAQGTRNPPTNDPSRPIKDNKQPCNVPQYANPSKKT